MLNIISALGNLMLPLELRPRGNIKLPRADIFNSHPAHRLLFLYSERYYLDTSPGL